MKYPSYEQFNKVRDQYASISASLLNNYVKTKNNLLKSIKEYKNSQNGIIFFISHNMQEVLSVCNKVLALNNGNQIFYGDTKKFFEDEKALKEAPVEAK